MHRSVKMIRRRPEPTGIVSPWWSLVVLGLAGCGGLEPVAPHEAVTNPTQLYAALTLQGRAVNLATTAPYNTIQLVATPRDGRDSVMSGLPAPTFYLQYPSDTAVLQVTSDGQVTARTAGSRIPVIAELTAPGPIRHADTALISVTAATPPVLDTLSIHPSVSDSAVRAMGVYDGSDQLLAFAGLEPLLPEPLAYHAADPTGTLLTDLVVEYASLDPAIATIDRWTGNRLYLRPGSARFVARTTAYGVAKADTVTFTVTWPLSAILYVKPAVTGGLGFEPYEVRIAPHGMAFFEIARADFELKSLAVIPASDTVDVVFDDPTNVMSPPTAICDVIDLFTAYGFLAPWSGCGTGHVLMPGLPPDTDGLPIGVLQARQFPVPGIYPFHSTKTGTTGRIIVSAGPEASGAP